jgi:hypothetical protein
MRIKQSIMENGVLKLIKGMEEVFRFGLTEADLKGIGKRIKQMLEES